MTAGGKSTFPNKLVAMVMTVVTGSPCLVRISMPEPIMLKPMKVPMPNATTSTVPMMFMLRMTPKARMPTAR